MSNMFIPLFFPQAKTEAEVMLEKEGLSQERVWVVHKGGFCLGTVVHDSPKKSTTLSTHVSFFKVQVGALVIGLPSCGRGSAETERLCCACGMKDL